MTTTPHKPLPCPNPKCDHMPPLQPTGQFTDEDEEFFATHFTCRSCGYRSPTAATEAEAIRLHNLICTPSAVSVPEPVGYRYKLQQEKYWQYGDGLPTEDFTDFCRRSTRTLQLLYTNPADGLREELGKLVEKWRERSKSNYDEHAFVDGQCADELSTLADEWGGKT